MCRQKRSQYEVWAYLRASPKSTRLITEFFVEEYDIKPEYIAPEMHLTIYHSRRPMPLLEESAESHIIAIRTLETRFMVLSPGGENPRPYLVLARERVGIRIKKNNYLREKIKEFRSTFFLHEDKKVLGRRKPSTHSKNAFGARNYQPHITILLKHSGIQRTLTEVGENFRNSIETIEFDKLIFKSRKNF